MAVQEFSKAAEVDQVVTRWRRAMREKSMTLYATLHDGNPIAIEISGDGPTLLLPVNPHPVEGPQAEEMRKWGGDPEYGRSLVVGLQGAFRVVAFDYDGHNLRHPKPTTLTPDHVVRDLLTIADAAGAERFAYYGYSWLGMIGMQLALRSDQLTALVVGGFPPLDGPYVALLPFFEAVHAESGATPAEGETNDPTNPDRAKVTASRDATRQFVTLFQALQDFDDAAAQSRIRCPRLCFVGSQDRIDYGPRFGNVHVDLAAPFVERRDDLERYGWDVRVLDGLNHAQAMQPAQVVPLLLGWLPATCGST
jgi:pimeloyl-ACP methyl ester carboxylesterase